MNPEVINESLEIMKEADRRAREAGTPLFINFSGGKDSSCLILLAKEANINNVELIYMESGLELPGCVDFVKQQAEKFGMVLHITNPVRDYYGDFATIVRKYGYFPGRGYTYCSSRLKLRPSRVYLRNIYGFKNIYRVNGVRKSESPRRAKMYKDKAPIRPDTENSGHFLVEPIHNWTGQDVKEYLEKHNFEVMEQYKEFKVSGCAYCPFYQVEIYQRILNIYPDIYDKIIEVENELGKPSVTGNKFLRDIKEDFFSNREEIMKKLNTKGIMDKK